jgi:hypothetical protein
MITGLPPDESGAIIERLSPEAVERTLDRVAGALRGTTGPGGDALIRRLRAFVDRCVPERPSGPVQLGALPEIVGTTVTLQYPLMQLERFLNGETCDIAGPEQAELYLSFVRYHLWKLEHLVRQSGRA